jgi:hypothetical protein
LVRTSWELLLFLGRLVRSRRPSRSPHTSAPLYLVSEKSEHRRVLTVSLPIAELAPRTVRSKYHNVLAISTAFKSTSSKFSGDLDENISEFLRQNDIVCRNFALPPARKFDLMHYLFRDDAKEWVLLKRRRTAAGPHWWIRRGC